MGIESPVHLLFIGAVALLVLGPKRLPEVARALGKGLREFREAMGQEPGGSAPVVESTAPATPADTQPSAPAILGSVFDIQPPAQVAHVDHGAPAVPSEDAAPREHPPAGVDPPQQVPSGGAPDRRPL
jgi:TatA/E family protein of Tat protein translocase